MLDTWKNGNMLSVQRLDGSSRKHPFNTRAMVCVLKEQPLKKRIKLQVEYFSGSDLCPKLDCGFLLDQDGRFRHGNTLYN